MGAQTRPKALVVDDEHVIADTLSLILSQAGFETAAAYDAQTALESARRFRPDILICDVVLRDEPITGVDVALQVRHWLPKCRILLLSGQANASDMLRSAPAQGHKFEILAKPVHPRELLARLRS